MWMKSRIEQHIIGAYLSGRPLPMREATLLRPVDLEHSFASHVLGDVFEVLHGYPDDSYPDAPVPEVIEQIGDKYARFGLSPAIVNGWCQQSITDRELAAGMRLFLQLGAEQDVRNWCDEVKESLNEKDGQEATRHLQDHLNEAITRLHETVAFATVVPDQDRRDLFARYETCTPLPVRPPAPERVAAEEQILAQLLINHGLCWAAAGIIDESSFTSSQRREVFRAINWIDRHDFDEDERTELTVNELVRARQVQQTLKPDAPAQPELKKTFEVMDRVQHWADTAEADCTKAFSLARDLLTADLRQSLEHVNWNHGVPMRYTGTDPDLQIPGPPQPGSGPQPRL